ncbi:hypothetical protein [Piscinibacter terrae]|uniref:hypothetical protein n=1 Tax=Piscinibacter terrae TaxID=2496871 RepID=UPI000F59A45C|nr:hypothetical protein [Albitalea terrae]
MSRDISNSVSIATSALSGLKTKIDSICAARKRAGKTNKMMNQIMVASGSALKVELIFQDNSTESAEIPAGQWSWKN